MLLFSSALQVCPWRADSVECYAAQSAHTFLATFSHLYLCARDASVRATNAWGHLRSDKRGQTQCYQTEKGSSILDACTESYLLKKKKKKGGDLSLHSLSSPSFSSCHSCWQSLIVLDKLMKSNTEEATGSLHLPECMSVCTYLPVPMSGRLVSSGVPASQSTRWWDSKRVMRSLSIPPGRGPFCRREVVININYSHIYAVRKLRGENA